MKELLDAIPQSWPAMYSLLVFVNRLSYTGPASKFQRWSMISFFKSHYYSFFKHL